MGMAICLKCGAQKNRPLTTCSGCQFDPQEPRDRAISSLLTDRYMEVPELVAAARRIRSGETLVFDDDELKRIAAKLPSPTSGRPAERRRPSTVVLAAATSDREPEDEPEYAERQPRRSWVPGLVAALIGVSALFLLSVLRYFFLAPPPERKPAPDPSMEMPRSIRVPPPPAPRNLDSRGRDLWIGNRRR